MHRCHPRDLAANTAPDPRLDRALRQLTLAMPVIVLLVPPLHGYHALVGWLPLWLVGMPALAWWGLHRFPLPLPGEPASPAPLRRPRRRLQALRRGVPAARRAPPVDRGVLPRAA